MLTLKGGYVGIGPSYVTVAPDPWQLDQRGRLILAPARLDAIAEMDRDFTEESFGRRWRLGAGVYNKFNVRAP